MSVGAVYVDFFKHRKADLVPALAEIGYRGAVAGFLFAELVAGKAQHHKSLIPVAADTGFPVPGIAG